MNKFSRLPLLNWSSCKNFWKIYMKSPQIISGSTVIFHSPMFFKIKSTWWGSALNSEQNWLVNFLHTTKKMFSKTKLFAVVSLSHKNIFFKFRIKLRWLVGYRHCWSRIWYSFWKWPYYYSYNNLAWHFLEKISRDTFTVFFLFCTKENLSDPDILYIGWPQWVHKMVKVSSQSDLV